MQRLDWSDLEVALAVARHGSLAGAARALRVDGATVSRRIARLRRVLGGPLFYRGSDRVLTLTDLGRDVADRAEAMETEIIGLLETARGADQMVQGLVRLTSTPLIVNRLLTPASPALLTASPGLQIELNAEPADLSLTKRDADMALRLARPKTGGGRVIARRVGKLSYAVYGPAGGKEALPWLTYEPRFAHLPQAEWMARRQGRVATLSANDAEGLIEAVAAGLGKTLLPIAIAARDARLTRLDDDVAITRELWLLTHRDLKDLPRIRAVGGWIEEMCGRLD